MPNAPSRLPTRNEFQVGIENGFQHLALLGMSGVGKSKWGKRISALPQFRSVEIDAQIGQSPEMRDMLSPIPGEDEVEKMGNLFGKPWEDPDSYGMQERRYLEIEGKKMKELAAQMERVRVGQALVADLTGSAIYRPEELGSVLDRSLGVYLGTNPNHQSAMLENYLADPKPVCWGHEMLGKWREAKGDRALEKLPELYGLLLKTRDQLYRTFAAVSIPWEEHRDSEGELLKSPSDLFTAIKKRLPLSVV